MKGRFHLFSVLLFLIIPIIWISDAEAQPPLGHQVVSGEAAVTNDHQGGHTGEGWEGSVEGIAYSEFNHHFAGVCDVVFGLAELGYGLEYPLSFWTRFVLPGALGVVGAFLLVWSDHDAWPIGSLGFVETFFGQDREIVEHKFYGVLAVAVAFCEILRRIGWARHPAWAAPLVIMTLVGSVLLFIHSHGNHPATARIELHHALLGSVGVCAALSKGLASWLPGASPHTVKRWEVVWAGSVILFGFLLLVYSE